MQNEGLGTDIIEIKRIAAAIERHGERFLRALFSENEKNYCQRYKDPAPHFAGRFAAKEAILKALGTGVQKDIGWLDIEIIGDTHGKPEVHLSERMRKNFPKAIFLLSISHCKEYATATAFLRMDS